MADPEPLSAEAAPRLFVLRRDDDVSGVSGLGDVAEGVEFSDGIVVLRWLRAGGSTAVYESLERMEAIHGHDGRTRVVFFAARSEARRLDVDVLLEALRRAAPTAYWGGVYASAERAEAEAIAAEYARLAQQEADRG